MEAEIKILVDNTMPSPFSEEHGLSLCITYGREKILFDTGAGRALPENLKLAGIDPGSFTKLILSHGHRDHTGGLARILPLMPQVEVCYAPGLQVQRFSRHPDKPVRDITMPEDSCATLAKHANKREITSFTRIADGVYLTGAIPRLSGEDCGGPFYLDAAGNTPDLITDEQALLLADGTLIQGCCHAGIINTVEHCRKCAPQIKIRSITGGLHLLHASTARLDETGAYLKKLGLESLTLLHCTGKEAESRFQNLLSGTCGKTAG